MEMECVILSFLEPKNGQSVKGSWKRQEIIVETTGEFKRKVCFVNWNDKVDLSTIKAGDKVKVAFDTESREFNGRWYTDLKMWNIQILEQAPPQKPNTQPEKPTTDDPYSQIEDDGDLPF